MCSQIGAERWYLLSLKKTGGDHHVSGLHPGPVGSDQIAPLPLCILFNRSDSYPVPNGKMKAFDILFKASDDLISQHETVRRVTLILCTGQSKGPIRGQEGKRVPPIVAPRVSRLCRLFENNVLATSLFQVVAGRQTGLSPTDNDGVQFLAQVSFLPTTRGIKRCSL